MGDKSVPRYSVELPSLMGVEPWGAHTNNVCERKFFGKISVPHQMLCADKSRGDIQRPYTDASPDIENFSWLVQRRKEKLVIERQEEYVMPYEMDFVSFWDNGPKRSLWK